MLLPVLLALLGTVHKTFSQETPLHLSRLLYSAVVDKRLDVVSSLLKNNSQDLGFVNEIVEQDQSSAKNTGARFTPLIEACLRGHSRIVQELIVTGRADVDAKSSNGFTALYAATGQGHLGIVKVLVESGAANVNMENGPDDETALMRAAYVEAPDTVRYLLEHDANVDQKSKPGYTALYFAVFKNNIMITQTLILEGRANANIPVGEIGTSVLMHAAGQGYFSIAELLIEKGNANPNMQSVENGETAVHHALQNGHMNVVRYLVDSFNANIHITDKIGCSTLFYSAQRGQEDAVKYLLEEHNIWVDQKSCYSTETTALQVSAQNGWPSVAKYLIEKGAEIDYKNRDRKTALYMAALEGHLEVVKALTEAGADVDMQNEAKEWTALHAASQRGDFEMVRFLVDQAGANSLARTGQGHFPLNLALERGHIRTAKYLKTKEECGKNVITEGTSIGPSGPRVTEVDTQAPERGSWPWLVSLGRFQNGKWAHSCGGSIISREHVLTAAHCLVPNVKMARLGDGSLSEKEGIQWRFIRKATVHPRYDEPYFDVAVLTLSSPVNVTNAVRPICLPSTPSESLDEFEGDQLDVAGWGLFARNDDSDSGLLRQTQQKVFSTRFCNASHQEVSLVQSYQVAATLPRLFSPDLMCAGYEFGKQGTCIGDSGGPLMRYTYYDSPSTAQYVQQGIVQGGIGPCGSKEFPSIYVRVGNPQVLAFIKGVISKSFRIKMEKLAYELYNTVEKDDLLGTKSILEQNQDNLEFVNLLVEMKIGENETMEATVLHRACFDGRASIALALVTQGNADVNVKSSQGFPAAHYAVVKHHKDVLEILVDKGRIDVNEKYGSEDTFLLMEASRINIEHMVDYLLTVGADPNQITKHRFYALYNATVAGYLRIAKLLVLKGKADANLRTDEFGLTAVHRAAVEGNLPLLRFLIEEGQGKPNLKNSEDGFTSFYFACSTGRPDMVRYIINSTNSDPSARSHDGITPFGIASLLGFLDVVRILVEEAGVDVDETFSKTSGTPLMAASNQGHIAVAEYLIPKGADVNFVSPGRVTALCMAVSHLKIVKLLAESGADVNFGCDKGEWTVLHLAAGRGFFDVLVYLVREAGADANLRSGGTNQTALEIAQEFGHQDIVRFLERR